MPDFVDGAALTRRLRAAFQDSENARLAVAFWGAGAADALGFTGRGDVQIICNLSSGGTNPQEIRTLLERGAKVRQLNDLHAKIGIVGELSFLGSSNMSANGLGAEGARANWREANIVYSSVRSEISNMIDRFLRESSQITEADLNDAQNAWDLRQRNNAVFEARHGRRSLVEVLQTAPEHLDALNVRVVVYNALNAEELDVHANGREQACKIYGDVFDLYWNWPTMTTEAATAYLVDFDWPARGRIARGTLYRRDTMSFADFEQNGITFHVAREIDDIEGITFGSADKAKIRAAFHAYVRDGHAGEDVWVRRYNFPISNLRGYLNI